MGGGRGQSAGIEVPYALAASTAVATPSTAVASTDTSTLLTSHRQKTCGGCRTAIYCSRGCQKADWKAGHKLECKQYADAAAAKDDGDFMSLMVRFESYGKRGKFKKQAQLGEKLVVSFGQSER